MNIRKKYLYLLFFLSFFSQNIQASEKHSCLNTVNFLTEAHFHACLSRGGPTACANKYCKHACKACFKDEGFRYQCRGAYYNEYNIQKDCGITQVNCRCWGCWSWGPFRCELRVNEEKRKTA